MFSIFIFVLSRVVPFLFGLLTDTLTDAAGGLIELYPHLDGILEVIFLPQLGFLVGLDDELDLNEAGVLPDDFEFLFKESNQLFYKCTEVRSLDENIGDLDTVSGSRLGCRQLLRAFSLFTYTFPQSSSKTWRRW